MAESSSVDINACLWPHLDSSLLLRLIDFYLTKGSYDRRKLLELKLKTLSHTMMDATARATYKELNGNENYPPSYEEHLKRVNAKKANLEEPLKNMLSFLKSQQMIDMLKEEKLFNMSYIKCNFSIEEKQLGLLFDYAKFLYDCGSYAEALNLLIFFRRLSGNKEKNISALWGQLGCYIILDSPEKAYETFVKLKDNIDSMGANVEQVNSRTWLLHWSLFLFFKSEEKARLYFDLAQESAYDFSMELTCRHLLRYIFASAMLRRGPDGMVALRDFVKRTSHKYRDEVTDFVQALTQKFDFETLPGILTRLNKMCENDYFLHPYADKILAEARATVVRVYSSIYSVISVDYIAKISGLKTEQATTAAMESIIARGMKPTFVADKKSIMVTLEELNVNKRIADKGKELEERTHKLEDFIAQGMPGAVVPQS